MRNTIMTVKNCSENEAKAIVLYLYRILDQLEFNLAEHVECQKLFNALVKRLDRTDHYKRVLDSFIEKLIKQKKLTPDNNSEGTMFDTKNPLSQCFKEDRTIYNNSGDFISATEDDVNLVRCCFVEPEGGIKKLLAYTFFCDSDENGFTIPRDIKPSREYVQAARSIEKVEFLKDSLKLSQPESEFLACSFRTNAVLEFYEFVNDLFRRESDRISISAIELGVQKKEIRRLLNSEGKLHSFGLFDTDGEFEFDAMAAIENQDINVYFADIIKKESVKNTYPLDSFSVKAETTMLIQRLLMNDSPCNLLFYGAPGAGKTEYAKALVKASGLKPLIFKNELEVKEDKKKESALYRLNCLLNIKTQDSVIIVDEAEDVLRTKSFSFFGMNTTLGRKGTVNRMLEASENKVIWLTNYTDEFDQSTLRRFTFSYKFGEMPRSMLKSIIQKKLRSVKMPSEAKTEIVDLMGKYRLTGSSADNVIKTIKGMNITKDNQKNLIEDVRQVLQANTNLVFGKAKMRELVNDSYDLSVLNTSIPPEELVEMVQNASEYQQEHKDCKSGIRMLFHGVSGSGKTELVRYLAEKLNKKIILKRASDIQSKFVGDNEKNIREAFEEAEATDSILLFDEADSFLKSRDGAKNSWEISEVNEFLSQAEEFGGILVCTTNFMEVIDKAMHRRFHIITEFKSLKKEGIEKLLGTFFGNYTFTPENIEKLAGCGTVTPGDFGSLGGKLRFVPKSKITSDYIVDSLFDLQKEKIGTKAMGFSA